MPSAEITDGRLVVVRWESSAVQYVVGWECAAERIDATAAECVPGERRLRCTVDVA